ncbi:MAG TPA: Dabb family protein [Solirubrobacteraceae bacterium]|nr:Dabb family protein [Solirubrobacteraceae bacterium]
MIRNVVMVQLTPGHDPKVVAEIQAGFRALDPPGCVAYTLGDDLGLREGNWSFAIVADFRDEAAYRAYDADGEHNRLRGLLAPHVETIARAQFTLEA